MELKNLKINFLGDSITQGCGSTDHGKTSFVARIGLEYGAIVRNYGIGGTRIARQTKPSEPARHDLDYCGRFAEMEDDADLVVVFGGTNDFGHGDAPFGVMSDRTVDTFYGALHTLYKGLIEKYPSTPIIVLTPLHRLGEENGRGLTLKQYVQAIREVAEFYSLPVLDLYASAGLQPQVPIVRETYMPDGLHPNDAGYKILADKVASFIKAL